jgi:glutathione S-transferase
VLEPKDPRTRALASQWMDWQLSVLGPAITPVFWGMVRTPPDKRDPAAIAAGKQKTGDAVKMLDDRLAKSRYLAGDAFSYGDIPAGIMVRRYRDLVPERPQFPHVERWYAAIAARPAFDEHVTKIPLV